MILSEATTKNVRKFFPDILISALSARNIFFLREIKDLL